MTHSRIPLNTFSQANDAQSGGESLEKLSPLETLESTLVGIAQGFFEHLPYMAVGFAVVLLTWLLSSVIGNTVKKLADRRNSRDSVRELLVRLTNIAVWTLGLLLAALVMFPGLTPAKALGGLGLLSVAIGFAFKEIFENFFAGILLLWKYPFEKGDFIECESIMGKVENISVRMTTIRKTDGELVATPNSFLFKNPVRVLTDLDLRRITIMTGVAYDEDADAAVTVIENALAQCDTVDNSKPVEVFLAGFGASSIDIEVTWWTEPTPLAHRKSRGEIVGAVKRALDDAGIEIPFPYRTMTFKEPLTIQQQR
ncbi:mechanosensitive ion channel family protein [Alteromonas oceanisediminis]|uniref:mechanosensitive ion channel family protein n=1 Tax=Alteromonas oceanisediminis TaxID=2836180 RepID=UPI001BD9BE71|nr:mechanosensitive ion channel family protein [Alteromonas oceanisediminis]MBT0585599.1 mechanosensitive ion channel family protein [Alteromonas oceanisediminis]